MKTKKTGYMCGIAFMDELGNTDVKVYPSAAQLKKSHVHVFNECGIAVVEIKFKRWVKKPTV